MKPADASRVEPLVQVLLDLSNGFHSANESDRNGETANVVDGLFAIARAIDRLGNSVLAASLPPTRAGDEAS
jgi:hypothetical protein